MRERLRQNLPTPLKVFIEAIKVWWDEWFRMVGMSLIWLFSWVTIILGPPVTFAFYDLAQRLVDESYPERREIVEAGKRHFGQSWRWMGVNLLVFFVLLTNYLFYDQMTQGWADVVKSAFLAIGIVWTGIQFYALPYLMLQEDKSLRTAWRNGLFTFLAAPVYTLILWVFGAFLAILSVGTVIPFLLGVPGIIVVLGSQAAAERIETYQIAERDATKLGTPPDKDER
jgi:uncharacterized membrane protein YesL